MYNDLVGEWGYQSGTGNATVTIPPGAVLLQLCMAGGTASIFGGPAVTGAAGSGTDLRFLHKLVKARSGANTIVFTGCTWFFVDYVGPTGL